MTNEQFIRNAYHVAEMKDIPGWVACFTPDGTFTDQSLGVTYRGPKELGRTVEVYAKAFPDMHRAVMYFVSRTAKFNPLTVIPLLRIHPGLLIESPGYSFGSFF